MLPRGSDFKRLTVVKVEVIATADEEMYDCSSICVVHAATLVAVQSKPLEQACHPPTISADQQT